RPMVDYPVPDDNLDGITREELTRARIAKHKEILTPEVQAPAAQRLMDENFANIHADLAAIRDELSRVAEILKERHDEPIENPAPSSRDASRGAREEQPRNPEESREGVRGGGQEGRRPTE